LEGEKVEELSFKNIKIDKEELTKNVLYTTRGEKKDQWKKKQFWRSENSPEWRTGKKKREVVKRSEKKRERRRSQKGRQRKKKKGKRGESPTRVPPDSGHQQLRLIRGGAGVVKVEAVPHDVKSWKT